MSKERITFKSQEQIAEEIDKDMIIADLQVRNANLEQQTNDMSLILANLQIKTRGAVQ